MDGSQGADREEAQCNSGSVWTSPSSGPSVFPTAGDSRCSGSAWDALETVAGEDFVSDGHIEAGRELPCQGSAHRTGQDGLAGAGDRGQGHMPGDWH